MAGAAAGADPGHVRGALNNGCTVEEIREALLHCAVYAGVPAAIDAFQAARNDRQLSAGRLDPAARLQHEDPDIRGGPVHVTPHAGLQPRNQRQAYSICMAANT